MYVLDTCFATIDFGGGNKRATRATRVTRVTRVTNRCWSEFRNTVTCFDLQEGGTFGIRKARA